MFLTSLSLFISLKVSLFTSNKALSNFIRFREKYPNILLKIIDAEDVENKVLGQRVDIGITSYQDTLGNLFVSPVTFQQVAGHRT